MMCAFHAMVDFLIAVCRFLFLTLANQKTLCGIHSTGRRHLLQIANLQQEVALKDAIHGRPGVTMDDIT